jgi:Tol biopolymer transport system component/DNA-binding winged helix-turn-helix (wHTH) protein
MVTATTKCRVLRFGVFELDLESRELRKRGIRIKLAGQSYHALLLLLERSPAVVAREELCRVLWPDELWGDHDHRLNKTINRIREVLRDSAETPRFLETLPRVGYRFLAPVERVVDQDVEQGAAAVAAPVQPLKLHDTAPVTPSPQRRRRFLMRLAIAVCLTFTVAFGSTLAYRFTRSKADNLPAAVEASPLTTFLGSELQPSFSPDGKQVAFIWNGEAESEFHVYVLPVNGGAPRQLTRGASSDYGPVWSPDGRRIAFLRKTGEESSEVHVVDVDGNNDALVSTLGPASTEHPLTWMHDPRWLVVSCRTAGDGPASLFLISTASGERRRLTSPAVQSGGDYSPAISPDGRKLAFIRWTNSSWQDVFVVALSRDMAPVHDPVQLTDLHRIMDTLAWTADGRELFFSSSPTLAGARFLFRVNASPLRSYGEVTDTGIEGLDPAVSPDGSVLTYARQNIEQTSIWRLSAGASAQAARPAPSRLTSSTRRDFTADMSPDGKRLVFSSARTGRTDIWLCDVDGSNLKRVTSFGASTPRWSPDGRKVVFESTRDGQSEIYSIEIETNNVRRLTFDPAADVRPSWSRNGRFVYFSSNRTGRSQIWKAPADGGEAVQITRDGGAYAVETMDGRNLYYVTQEPPSAIRYTTVNGGEERQIIDNVVGYASLAMGVDGLYYLAALTPTGARVDVFDFATHKRRPVLSIDRPVHHFLSSPPDGRSILYTRIDREDSDLMLRRLRRE